MFVSPDSPVGVRFFAAIKDGQGINKSARLAGIHTSTGYRFLQTAYLRHRRAGLPAEAVLQLLGFRSTYVLEWESQLTKPDRHHLRVDAVDEDRFWSLFESGMRPPDAAGMVGVSRPTADRWLQKRFISLRDAGMTIRQATAVLRLTPTRATRFEDRRLGSKHAAASTQAAAVRNALSTAGRHADTVLRNSRPPGQQRAEARRHAYWELMRNGMSNTDACTLLGMSRVHGSRLRKEAGYKIPPPPSTTMKAPRYLELRERLQIADLLHLGHSLRTIATQLGRSPSTVSRELRRHRDSTGRYLPRTAHHDALQQRSRPKIHRLVSHHRLRSLIQRKLNRYWSPDEISGWLKKAFPDDPTMRLCPETIYRALLLREDHGLKKNLATKLRTGRRIRKTRWVSRYKQGSRIRNMTMIDRRPEEHSSTLVAGNWEGDLIVGVGSVSAMVTLRERKTQYGIIVNLPEDHTAASVNAAVTAAFNTLPRHLKKSLTWDQGVEMSSHEALTEATGVPIYFAERSSPWQRGANENFNGLARQFFPKGTDLSTHSADHVAKVMKELNDRPRKGLGYDTPAARLQAERNTPTRQFS